MIYIQLTLAAPSSSSKIHLLDTHFVADRECEPTNYNLDDLMELLRCLLDDQYEALYILNENA